MRRRHPALIMAELCRHYSYLYDGSRAPCRRPADKLLLQNGRPSRTSFAERPLRGRLRGLSGRSASEACPSRPFCTRKPPAACCTAARGAGTMRPHYLALMRWDEAAEAMGMSNSGARTAARVALAWLDAEGAKDATNTNIRYLTACLAHIWPMLWPTNGQKESRPDRLPRLTCCFSWLGQRDSNPRNRHQKPGSCRWTMPQMVRRRN